MKNLLLTIGIATTLSFAAKEGNSFETSSDEDLTCAQRADAEFEKELKSHIYVKGETESSKILSLKTSIGGGTVPGTDGKMYHESRLAVARVVKKMKRHVTDFDAIIWVVYEHETSNAKSTRAEDCKRLLPYMAQDVVFEDKKLLKELTGEF